MILRNAGEVDIFNTGFIGPKASGVKEILIQRQPPSDEQPVVYEVDKQSYKRGKICTSNCKYQNGKQKHKQDPVQCYMCQHWTHPSCVEENEKDIIGIWSCPSCRATPDLIHGMYEMMLKMQQDNAQLKSFICTSLAEMKDQQTKSDQKLIVLSTALNTKSDALDGALKEIGTLRGAISELTNKLSAQQWNCFLSEPIRKPTLVAGSSIIRDFSESKLENTDVVSISGGCISDVSDAVSKQPSDKYGRIVLVAGGNVCDPRDPSCRKMPSVIVDKYKELVNICKEKASSVTVSSICPRGSNVEVKSQIDSVNAGLQVICADEDEKVSFVDNSSCFYLKNDSVNEAYFLDDGIHLNYKGTNKLAQNLQLKTKVGETSVCEPKRRFRHSGIKPVSKQKPSNHESTVTSQEDDGTDFSHFFWSHSREKVKPSNKRDSWRKSRSPKRSHDFNRQIDAPNSSTSCYNCFERNHTSRSCRHEHPIICNSCGQEGHKSKHHDFF